MSRFAVTALPAALLVVPLLSTAASAQCAAIGPLDIACTVNGTTPLDESIDGLTVTVFPGVSIEVGTDDAIRLRGSQNTLINDGAIEATGSGDEAVQADDVDFTVINTGLIVSAGDKAIQAEAFSPGSTTSVVNDGTIVAGTEGIEAGNNFILDNRGLIDAGEDGVQFGDGAVENSGTIRGGLAGDGDGVDMDSGSLVNTGTIEGEVLSSAAIDIDEVDVDGAPITAPLEIANFGTLSGSVGILVEPDLDGGPNESVQMVTNGGTISGLSGIAISLAAGDDTVALESGSDIFGDILLGAGADLLTLETGITVSGDSLLSGGAGNMDMLAFGDTILPTDISFTPATLSDFDLAFDGSIFRVSGFERVAFDSGAFFLGADGGLAPVPLPAALPLLLAGLGGLALLRRRG